METKKLPGRIRLVHDDDCQWDLDDDCVKIAYLQRSRECLGTEAVSQERMDEIRGGIAGGSLVGIPVYAYVHSGASIRTTPFSCPWDSGQSGFVYLTAQDAHQIWGLAKGDGTKVIDDNTMCTEGDRERALEACRGLVESYDQYLTGDCWGYVIDDAVEDPLRPGEQLIDVDGEPMWDETTDSCFGFLGHDPKTNGMDLEYWLDKGYKIVED